jgi:hypothetical protein
MRTRNVKRRVLVGPQHSGPSGAIAFAENYNRDHHRPDEHRVVGKRIESVSHTDDFLALHVEGASLVASINGAEVVYQVQDEAGPDIATMLNEEPMRLSFAGQASIWDRPAVARALVGQALTKIFVTPDSLYLYASKAGIVAVSAQADADTGAPFLYWDFSQ